MSDESDSLVRTIATSGGGSALADLAELTIDQLLDPSVAKDVPVLGLLAKLRSVQVGVRDFLFIKKLQRFLSNLAEVVPERRKEFASRMDADPSFRTRVGENLILAIDRLDDTVKTDMLAKAFSAFVASQIEYGALQQLTFAIDRCLVIDLENLASFRDAYPATESGPILVAAGLLDLTGIPTVPAPGVNNTYGLTAAGKLFLRVVLGEDAPAD